MRRILVVIMATMVIPLSAPAVTYATNETAGTIVSDRVGGSLTCSNQQVVWIRERSSAGTTTISVEEFFYRIIKNGWSSTTIRTELAAATWSVSSTGVIDHAATGAYCGP